MGGVTFDPAALIVALSALGTMVWGIRQSRRGQKTEENQQAVANTLQRKAQNHDVYRDMVADLERQVDRRDADLERVRKVRVDELRECAATIAMLRDLVRTLQGAVLSEVAKGTADRGLAQAAAHVENHPDPDSLGQEDP